MFKFSLQPVLEHRNAIEGLRQREYHEVVGQIADLEAQKERFLEQQGEGLRTAAAGAMGPRDMAFRRFFGDWVGWVGAEIDEISHNVLLLSEEAETRRLALAEAAKQKKIMEKLRDKEEEDWKLDEARAEQKLFDEIAIRGFQTKAREEKLTSRQERISL